MPGTLSEQDVDRYQRDGYLSPLRVMSAERAAGFKDQYDAFRAREGAVAEPYLRTKPHLVLPWLYDLVSDPAVLAPVQSILGANLLVWSTSFFAKHAGDPGYVSWHQDANYWGLEPFDIATAWIAFTPSRRSNGCMRVIPGTQNGEALSHRDTYAEHNFLSRGQEIAVEIDEASAADITLEPGEMSVHHVGIVHGSDPNTSAIPRIGFAIRYIATHVRQTGGRTTATLASGVDEYGHFDHEPRPGSEFDAAARAYREESLARVQSVIYAGAEDTGGKPRIGVSPAE